MVLEEKTIEKIKSLVYQRPRNINEIAIALNKNWRTVDRYIEEIISKTGTIKTFTFREGSRGALKIVYWNNNDKIYSTDIQEELFKRMERGINKSDFSPFDIYQYVDSELREAYKAEIEDEITYNYNMDALETYFKQSQKQICIFAGNLAFIHIKNNKKKFIENFKEALNRGVSIKIITNINLIDLKNVEELLSLNRGLKDPLIDIRHEVSPIRTYVFDDFYLTMGEILPTLKKQGQVKNKIAVYYRIMDENWILWMEKIFWKKFQNAIPSAKRIDNLNSIKKLI